LQAGRPEGIAFKQEWISAAELGALADKYAKTAYRTYLKGLL
jgi:glucose-1-phosphate thymidylyltransferase